MTDERPDGRSAFEAGLANEYFALSGLRASSIAEAGTRATLFFTTLTGTVLALGFLAGTTSAVVALRAINRIRTYYAGLVPEGTDYFPAPGQKQAINELVDIGERRALWRATLTIAATVGVMDALVTGASLAFALSHVGAPTALAVVMGIIVALAIIWGIFVYQSRRFGAALRVVESTP